MVYHSWLLDSRFDYPTAASFCIFRFLKTGKKTDPNQAPTASLIKGLKTLEFNKEKERYNISPAGGATPLRRLKKVLKVNETAAQLLVVESREIPLGSAVGPSVSSSCHFQPSQTAVFCKLSLKLSF